MERIIVSARIESITAVAAFVDGQLEKRNCDAEIRFQIGMAVEEIFVNIASYAYAPGTGEAEIQCEVLENPLRIVIRFLDSGKPFDPLAQEEADTSEEALLERTGGLGIFMVRTVMDSVTYSHENGKNILTIMKNCGAAPQKE